MSDKPPTAEEIREFTEAMEQSIDALTCDDVVNYLNTIQSRIAEGVVSAQERAKLRDLRCKILALQRGPQ